MGEIKGFALWQWNRMRKTTMNEWLYVVAVVVVIFFGFSEKSTTVIFGLGLDIWAVMLGGLYIVVFIFGWMLKFQLDSYRREKDLISRKLQEK